MSPATMGANYILAVQRWGIVGGRLLVPHLARFTRSIMNPLYINRLLRTTIILAEDEIEAYTGFHISAHIIRSGDHP